MGRLVIVDAGGRTHVFAGGEGPSITVRLHDKALHWRLFWQPELCTGEAYMDGTLTIENGTLYDFLDLIGRNIEAAGNRPLSPSTHRIERMLRRLYQFNPKERARRNVAHHYDLSGALYDLFLDDDRQYSCAYFRRPGDSLATAQEQKKRHIAAKLLLQPGVTVLDIGSGWGGLDLYLADEAGAKVTGVTLSTEQLNVARRRADETGLAGRVGYVVADARTGAVLESLEPMRPVPPASTLKAMTALYALETLGAAHRFETRLVATGPVRAGRLEGDLVLVGGGDPSLDTDGLHDLAAQARAAGLAEVGGRLLVDSGVLPAIRRIDPRQPDQVAYDPAVGGVNLNFNRVHFSWTRAGSGYATAMDARTERFRPEVASSRMRIADRSLPVYTYVDAGGVDEWTVARGQLGTDGARWLPVRNPDAYAGDVLRSMLRLNGIAAPAAQAGRGSGTTIALVQGASLDRVAASMLRFSTNLVAEVMGLAATARRSGNVPSSLAASAGAMADWAARRAGARRADLDDHSGLNGTSRIAAADMAALLTAPGAMAALRPILRELELDGPPPQRVRAKTGTLNFVSGLAGYFDARSGRPLAFATLSADTDRRDRLSVGEMEQPAGGQGWARAARSLQFDLIERWAAVHA